MNNMFLSFKEAAAFLMISKSTLYKKTSLREIPFCKPGGKLILFQKTDLEQYLSKNRIATKTEIENSYLTTLKHAK